MLGKYNPLKCCMESRKHDNAEIFCLVIQGQVCGMTLKFVSVYHSTKC